MAANLFRFFSKFFRGLSFKLSFYAGLVVFLALMAFAYHSIKAQEQNLTAKMIQVAEKDSEVIKAAIWHGMMTKDREVIREIISAISRRAEFGEINIFDQEGVLRYSSHADENGVLTASLADPLKRRVGSLTAVEHVISDDGRTISVVNPLFNSRSCSSAGCHHPPVVQKTLGALAIKMPLDDFRAEIYANARKTVIFAYFLFILISTIIGLAVIFLVTPSIHRLQKSAAKIAQMEFLPREGSNTWFDDISDLSRSFEEMSRAVSARTTHLDSRRKFWKFLYQGVPCYLTTVSQDYRITTANQTFTDVFGDRVGQNCFVGYKGADIKCPDCPVEKTFADGESHQSEEEWRQNGRTVYVIVKTTPIFDERGHVSEVLEMSLDVTKLKELQMELDEKRREYKNLFEMVPGYLTVVDTDFNIVQANKQFLQDFGDKTGTKCFTTYKGRDSRCDDCPVAATFADSGSHTSEHIWFREGQPIYLVVKTTPIRDSRGRVVAAMELCTDVTEMKKLQRELALLGETVAGMSHTIKNILGGLEGGVYMVDSGLERDKDDRVHTGWRMVKHNVGKVSDLVKGILYASKEREPEYKLCDPEALLTEVCDLYQDKALSEGIKLTRNFGTMAEGLLDPAGIHSVVSNLIANALDACRGRQTGKHNIAVSAHVAGGNLIVEVKDDGPGMDEEVKNRVFEGFYSTKGSKGTGLGLLIARQVIHEHGGIICVESEPGRGTAFSFTIPFNSVQDEDGLRTAV